MGRVPAAVLLLPVLLGILLFPCPSAGEMVLAVPDFQAVGCMPYLSSGVAEQVRAKLTGRGPWTLLESSQMAKIASEHRLSMSGLMDEKKAISVGKVLGAQYLIVGSVSLTGSVFTLTARLVDVSSGVVHAGYQTVTHEGEESLPAAAGFLAEDIAAELGGPDA
jgi:TolB-like protein